LKTESTKSLYRQKYLPATLVAIFILTLTISQAKSNPAQAAPNQSTILKMRITAYCPCEKCCGSYADGITASGHKIENGDTFVAADRRYKLGTEMLIPGYNNSSKVKVLDRGGAIKGNRLDVFFNTHQQALEWGVRYLDVEVLSTIDS
jgi:3D (Asp-Asp-Asp) domain-containing protein